MNRKKAAQLAGWAMRTAAAVLLVCLLVPPLVCRADRTLPWQPVTLTPADCRAAVLEDSREALAWRLRLIDEARETLTMAVYDFREDTAGCAVAEALGRAAGRGVQVRLVVDGISGQSALLKGLAALPGTQVRIYNPIRIGRLWHGNYRMHDKYLIADRSAWILGGRNVSDKSLLPGGDLDRDLLVLEGAQPSGALEQLAGYFREVWEGSWCCPVSPTSEDPGLLPQMPGPTEDWCWSDTRFYPVHALELLRGDPAPENKDPVVWKSLAGLMAGQDVLLETPYIICDRAMYRDLHQVIQQGGSLRILTNAPETGANLFGCAALPGSRSRLTGLGAMTAEWLGGGSLHGKTLVVGDRLSLVGSFNLDMRSAYLDTELMVAVDSPELNAALRSGLERRMEASRISLQGEQTLGPDCLEVQMAPLRAVVHRVAALVTAPFRYLL